MLTILSFCIASFLLGMVACFPVALRFSRANREARMDAIRLIVAVLVVKTYIVLLVTKATKFSDYDPPMMLGALAALVIASLFPRGIVRFGKDGVSLGGDSTETRHKTPVPCGSKPVGSTGSDGTPTPESS